MQRLAAGRFDPQGQSHVLFCDASGQWWDACGQSPYPPTRIVIELDRPDVDCEACRESPAYQAFLRERQRVVADMSA